MFLQKLQNAAGDLLVLFEGLREDEDVVHHRLEGGGAVRKAEEHDQGFEQATVGSEGGLPLVSLLYPDVVKAPADV